MTILLYYRLLSAASSTFAAFVIGAAGSILGTVVAWLILGSRLGPDGWKVCLQTYSVLFIQSFIDVLQHDVTAASSSADA